MEYLDETTKYLHRYTKRRFREGKIRIHIGLRGQLVLMLDKLDRVLQNQALADIEIQDLASDALIALWHLTCMNIREQMEQAQVEEEVPDEREE